jgi:hypothetical protein
MAEFGHYVKLWTAWETVDTVLRYGKNGRQWVLCQAVDSKRDCGHSGKLRTTYIMWTLCQAVDYMTDELCINLWSGRHTLGHGDKL